MQLLEVFIGTRFGVRLEHVVLSSSSSASSSSRSDADDDEDEEDGSGHHYHLGRYAVLHHEGGFQDHEQRVRVRTWNAAECAGRWVSHARFVAPSEGSLREEYDGDHSANDDDDDDDDAAPPAPKRAKVVAAVQVLPRRRTLATPTPMPFLELDLTDANPEDVAYVWVVPLSASSCCWNAHGALANSLPHPFHSFRIENTCGACMLSVDAPLDLDRFRVAGSDQIVLLGGTLAERLNGREVDFRGVRGVMRLLHELSELTRVPRAAVRVTVYMVVMKGCVGTPTMVVDYGMRPPATLGGAAATLAEEGFRRCYLAERMAPWCEGYAQHVEVCQVWIFF